MANVVEKCKRMAFTADTAQCGNYGNSLSHIFGKNFVKVTVLLNKLLNKWFDEIFFQWELISVISTMCCGNW